MTPRERAERLIDLTGEIKQADALIAECERDEADKLRQLQLASEATLKQRANREDLYAEARRLGEEAKAAFDALVPAPEPPPPVDDDAVFECSVIHADAPSAGDDFTATLNAAIEGENAFANRMFDAPSTNGIDNAFREATNP